MLLPIVFAPEKDELLYGWYKRLEHENMIGEGRSAAHDFFMAFFDPTDRHEYNGGPRYDYMLNLETICKSQSIIPTFPSAPEILRYHTDYYAMLPLRTYGEQVKLAEYILRPRTGRKTDIPKQQSRITEFHCREDDDILHLPDHLPGVRVYNGKPLLVCRIEDGRAVPERELTLKCGIAQEEKLSSFIRHMYEQPMAISLDETKRFVRLQLEKKGFEPEYPYGGLADAIREAGYEGFFESGDISVRVRKLLAQNSIIYEEMLALLSFLFDEYSVFYDTVIQVCPPFISALEGSDEIVGKYDPIIEIRCWVCGNVYYAHKFAPLFGVGCPHCNRHSSDDDIAMRYLSQLGDGKYRLMETFRGFGKRTEIIHMTCGRIRNVNFSDMIWGRRCCVCESKLPLKEIQQRVDPTEMKFKVIEYNGAKGEKQRVRIKCLVCGDEFETQLAVFLEHPYCRACMEGSRYRENFKKQVIELGRGEYDLVTPYVNEKTKVKIRHRRCFTETDMYPGNFIAGQRCALCTPANKEEREYSIRSSVYMAIRDICVKNLCPFCFREDLNDMLVFSSNVISSAIRNLVKSGYILQLGGGAYGFHPHDPDEVAYRKYIFRNGQTEGVYGYDSAAYNEGITDEKPEVGYIFTNLVSHDDAFRVTINDKIFKVRAPLFPVNDSNKDIHTALNLLMYAAEHSEKSGEVRRWMEEMSLTPRKLKLFIGSYPLSASKGFSLIFEEFSAD